MRTRITQRESERASEREGERERAKERERELQGAGRQVGQLVAASNRRIALAGYAAAAMPPLAVAAVAGSTEV